MKPAEMHKIKKYARLLRFVMNVLYWGAVIMACLAVISAAVVVFMPDSHFMLGNQGNDRLMVSIFGIIRFALYEELLRISQKGTCIMALLMTAALMLLVAFASKKLVHIMKSVDNDMPFEKENADRIHAIGTALVWGSLLVPAFEFIPARVMINMMEGNDIPVSYSVNIYLLMAGLLLFVLSGIFRYGSYLQAEYDETV
ncbi:DUF2975 domain-containing protein [Thermoclostridium caenicola]|uniref:DUF2975 domain-containing protein n=1 Tax=Thermoclostridium caenicola TaxID=659425 RepID=A0A1M6CLF6_9FIRM|nr:DUF2975 domain-containing protein [Thermoclostridium caenicola]SHI61820.1 Protein of unknown function [Thermoclostridium caenicola]HOP73154.1 DUF2975 domain-containing protein [Thermoclostridium caenicola]